MSASGQSWSYISRIRPYVRPYRKLAAGSVFLIGFGVVVDLAGPWPLAFLVDTVLTGREPPAVVSRFAGGEPAALILVAVVAGLVLTLADGVVGVLTSFVNTKFDQRMVLDFRSDLFENTQKLSRTFHDEVRSGQFAMKINFQASSLGNVAVALPPLAQSALTLVGMFVVAYRLDAQLALISLVVVPFVYFSIGYYTKRVEPEMLRVRGMEGQSLTIVHEAMAMMKVIVAFRRERYEHRRFRSQGAEAVDARIKLTVRQTVFSLAVNAITATGTALVLGFGAHAVLDRRLTVGELLVIMTYIAAVYAPLTTISSTITSLQEQLVDVRMAFELLDTEAEVVDPPDGRTFDRVEGRVTFDHVGFSYKGRADTLSDINFEARPGSVTAIVGPTGAGKSTLVSLLPRFYDPAEGRVLLDGVDVRDITLDSLRDQFSVVLQEPLLFSGGIAENIRYGRLEATMEEIVAAARAANAHDFISRLPKKYDTQLGEGGAQLSGGERQRISVARAFLKDAPVLILDEPTSSIDSRTEAVILDALDHLMEHRTTFIVAHRLSTIRSADQILVMNDGHLIDSGGHDDLIGREGLYRELYEAQSGQARFAANVEERRRRLGGAEGEALGSILAETAPAVMPVAGPEPEAERADAGATR